MNLDDLLDKSPLEMSEEEIKTKIEKLQMLRRIPDFKTITKRKTISKESPLEQALKAAALKKTLEAKK